MSEPVWGNANYLVLHFERGKLCGTKVTQTWRGAMMSKRNHEKIDYFNDMNEAEKARWTQYFDRATRIIPISAVLAIKGLEKPDTELSAEDIRILRRMGIA
jgi:hypothetical protein